MSMQTMINDACAARARENYVGYDMSDDMPDRRPDPIVESLQQVIPAWLTAGLQQYVDLVNPEGIITPRDPEEAFGHLWTDFCWHYV